MTNIMKRLLFFAAVAACLSLLVSCEKEGVPHTGDETGTLYGIWALTTKTEISRSSSGDETVKESDYTGNHFYLALSEFPFPHAIAKKGSFKDFDLDDVDIDAVSFTYNADTRQISFKKTLWLSDDSLTRNMILKDTFDVVELTGTDLSIQQKESLSNKTIVYSYKRQK